MILQQKRKTETEKPMEGENIFALAIHNRLICGPISIRRKMNDIKRIVIKHHNFDPLIFFPYLYDMHVIRI